MITDKDKIPPVALEQRGYEDDQRMFSPSAARNSAPLLAALKRALPGHGRILEIGCGTGEHAVCFAEAMPTLTWLPTDPLGLGTSDAVDTQATLSAPQVT